MEDNLSVLMERRLSLIVSKGALSEMMRSKILSMNDLRNGPLNEDYGH